MNRGLTLPVAALLAAGALAIVYVRSTDASAHRADRPAHTQSAATPSTVQRPGTPTASPLAVTSPELATECASGSATTVHTAAQLTAALAAAKAGSIISLASGTYLGNFTASVSGTASAPITLCGTGTSILDGGNVTDGYVLHLSSASWWQLYGFSVQDAQKGVVLDHSDHDLLESLYVHAIGDEAIHLREFSSDNTVSSNVVQDTGHQDTKYGEGIYVGTAYKNWCTYTACQPDNSDRNVIKDNTISHTTAENIDIKEGTTGGVIDGNQLSGVGMLSSAATAWVNVKGNSWTVQNNVGMTSLKDGFQVHQVYSGWGLLNTFRSNHATVNAPGYGYYVQRSASAVVYCSNTETGAASGLSNVACTPG